MKLFLLLFYCLLTFTYSFSQVGIGTENPDASSILDIVSAGNNKGILIPRMTLTQKNNINSPAEGLLLYQTDQVKGLYVYINANWKWIFSSVNSSTHVDINNTIAIGGVVSATNSVAIGVNSLVSNTTGSKNTAIGYGALSTTTTVTGLTAIGYEALGANTSGVSNTAIGYESLSANTIGNNNTANGYQALKSNTIGNHNTAVGFLALTANVSGFYNTAIGYKSLLTNNTGTHNTANGRRALSNNTGGSYNTAIGNAALYYNIGGNDNTAVGHEALIANTSGNNNIANGGLALQRNQGGNQNVASGYMALRKNVSGNHNVAVGFLSLVENTASYNTAIGYLADVGANNLTNATAIGYNASVSASNKIRLGDANVTVIQGQVGYTSSSDRRLKKNIINTKYGLNTILKIRPVDYQLKSNNLKQIGFIAQELKSLVPEAVNGIEGDLEKGEALGITYTLLIPILTKAIQEQQIIINDLLNRVNKLENNK